MGVFIQKGPGLIEVKNAIITIMKEFWPGNIPNYDLCVMHALPLSVADRTCPLKSLSDTTARLQPIYTSPKTEWVYPRRKYNIPGHRQFIMKLY